MKKQPHIISGKAEIMNNIDLISRGRENTGDYFPSLHIYRGAAEVNMARKIIKLVFSRPKEIRVLSQGTRSPLTCPSPRKCETKASWICGASVAMLVQVVRGCPVRNTLIDFLPPAIVSSQIAQVDRPKILERMAFGSSPILSGVFVTFFFSN